MSEQKLMKGNEAFAEAAIRAGCKFYFGYPITPQNELTEYMSRELEGAGGAFVQAESELAAVNMAYGGAAAGGRVLISSSSPGIALMQEGLSFICSADLPLVIINVSRGGPGVGSIQPGQADYFQATRGGGNGDYHLIVYAPSSLQEAVDMLGDAFDTADAYRNPVMLLVDGVLGQMMEPVVLPDMKRISPEDTAKRKPWALTGHKGRREHNVIRSLYLKPEALECKNREQLSKYERAEQTLAAYEGFRLEDAEIVLVAYGSTSRIVRETIDILSSEGIKAGLLRPKTLWPFPYKAFDELSGQTKMLVSVELSMGQMMQDVLIGSAGRWPVSLVSRTGGMLLTPEETAVKVKKLLEGQHGNHI